MGERPLINLNICQEKTLISSWLGQFFSLSLAALISWGAFVISWKKLLRQKLKMNIQKAMLLIRIIFQRNLSLLNAKQLAFMGDQLLHSDFIHGAIQSKYFVNVLYHTLLDLDALMPLMLEESHLQFYYGSDISDWNLVFSMLKFYTVWNMGQECVQPPFSFWTIDINFLLVPSILTVALYLYYVYFGTENHFILIFAAVEKFTTIIVKNQRERRCTRTFYFGLLLGWLEQKVL